METEARVNLFTIEELEKRENSIKKSKEVLAELRDDKTEITKKLANISSDCNVFPERADFQISRDTLAEERNKLDDKMNFYISDIAVSEKTFKRDMKTYRKENSRYAQKIRHNRLTRKEATNHLKPYTREEYIDIFTNCKLPAMIFLNPEVEFYRQKFKRTYCAIEGIVRVKQYYQETGEIRDFYLKEDKSMTTTANEFKEILDKLIEDKII